MKEVVLPILSQGSKIVSVYMVYLHGMSHLLEINVINAFYQKFEITLVNFLVFLLLTSKKRKAYVFNLLSSSDQCFLLCRFIAFFNDHGTWLLLLEYF